MRIKNLQINYVFRIKNLDVEFSDTDNIICVIEKYKDEDELPFGSRVLDIMESLFLIRFLDCMGMAKYNAYAKNIKKIFLFT